jgi:hypothetical protein
MLNQERVWPLMTGPQRTRASRQTGVSHATCMTPGVMQKSHVQGSRLMQMGRETSCTFSPSKLFERHKDQLKLKVVALSQTLTVTDFRVGIRLPTKQQSGLGIRSLAG